MYWAKVVVPPKGIIILDPNPKSDGRYGWEVIRADGTNHAGHCNTLPEGLAQAQALLISDQEAVGCVALPAPPSPSREKA
jgi:hypothetical protein